MEQKGRNTANRLGPASYPRDAELLPERLKIQIDLLLDPGSIGLPSAAAESGLCAFTSVQVFSLRLAIGVLLHLGEILSQDPFVMLPQKTSLATKA
ncbi:MAG TPA: hypothetical protein VF173_01440 [Thermoanaerobaculia bacterium]|nr:hypothetical protein [Thermoanaerobaculia bacterium]